LPAPIHNLRKDVIIRLANQHCKAHRHTYLDHYNCYLKEIGERQEIIGHLDIECSNLDADFGIILSYCILDDTTNKILEGVITKKDINIATPGQEDKVLVTKLISDLGKFDKLVTFYGARFDLPYIRTRAMVDGIPFPLWNTLKHKDIYFTVKGKFKLSSNRLENACRVILGKTRKTRVDAKHWRAGVRGEAEGLAYILKHNRYDVIDLKKLYHAVIDFARPVANSI
jgi:uncharacterized protein YprB with RNaseH-like and TPR domain